ncbi:MAG: translocation/assembly module TamB domain-containing protein [Synechococcaceae cyanobacterium]|nr:translocation/assembly module TamB domain-containing protein [Synechococcaceae cyanobacterium]
MALGLAGVAAAGAWWGGQRLAAQLYERWRPGLERQLSPVIGHPVRLGPFRRLGLDGVHLGPSSLLPQPQDRSSVSAAGLRLQLDPLASWRLGGPVLDLRLDGVRASLHRHARGGWWQLGTPPRGKVRPLSLRLQLPQEAAVQLHDNRPGLPIQRLRLRGEAHLQPHRRRLDLQLGLGLADRPGRAALQGSGRWDRGRWWARVQPQQWPLDSLLTLLGVTVPGVPLAPPVPGDGGARTTVQGALQGLLSLRLERGRFSCSGEAELERLRWRATASTPPLQIERLPLRCREQQLEAAPARWRFGDWRGDVVGRVDVRRRLELAVRTLPPGAPPTASPLRLQLAGVFGGRGLQDARLELRRGDSRLALRGLLQRQPRLAGSFLLAGSDLVALRGLPGWLRPDTLQGDVRLDGTLGAPRLWLRTGQDRQALLGPWQAELRWAAGLLELERFASDRISARGSLPLALRGRRLQAGVLQARLAIRELPLQRLNPLLGARLQGQLSAAGELRGPLEALRPDLQIALENPGVGPLRLQESWRGRLRDRQLLLQAQTPALPGRLQARLDARWQPVQLALQRDGGSLLLRGAPRQFGWQASRLPLQGLSLALGASGPPRPLQGAFSGSGQLGLQPLGFRGRVRVSRPEFLGVGAEALQAEVRYSDRDYQLRGRLEPFGGGQVAASLQGRWQGPIRAELQARALSEVLFRQLRQGWGRWQGESLPARGQAADLGSLAIGTVMDSLDDQLQALAIARQRQPLSRPEPLRGDWRDLQRRLRLRLDADLILRGPDLQRLQADLTASGHLWFSHRDRDQALAAAPLQLRLEGPLRQGEGTFSLNGLSFALLQLLTPIPETLRGGLVASGRYRLGGRQPAIELDLDLNDGRIGSQALVLERGRVELGREALRLDLAVRAEGASSSVDLVGRVPLDPGREDLELRVSSRGDGLWFLANLAPESFRWTGGRTDLQLLVRGSLNTPIANGFLRLREGRCRLLNQSLSEVDATVLFDFEQLLVQGLRARVGPRGSLRSEGRIGLVRPLAEAPALNVSLEQVPIALGRLRAVGAGRLQVGGSLLSPALGGQLSIANGAFDARPGDLAVAPNPGSNQPVQATGLDGLLESRWDFRQPLVLLGPANQSGGLADSLSRAVPRAPWLRFERLRLRFGPDLRVVIGTIANFRTAGLITVNGPLDPSLKLSGVMRLLGGRLNLFTTSFSLDPDTANVAVFTPTLGLVPYLDIALRTRVADSLNLLLPDSTSMGLASIQGTDPTAGFASFSQMKLVQVTVSVTGPADRIAENLRLRSSPPLPQERLVALIGGNSLAGLSGGAAGTALATAVGQTLLSPLLSSLSDVFGQRVSLAIYPSYVNQAVANPAEVRSQRVPPQLVLATEIGFDITNRFKASVLAAPNRSDIPSQLTLNYKASDTFSFETSVDTQGAFGGQLQVFFRF